MYVLYGLNLKLRLKKSSFKVFFITQIGHTPGPQTQIAARAEWGLKKDRAALWLP